jgi:hypothetical protein
MKLFILGIFMLTASTIAAENLTRNSVALAGTQLEDVMEIIDTTGLRDRVSAAEKFASESATLVSRIRLGILYHEAALNFSFISTKKEKGWAAKSYLLLDSIYKADTSSAFRPYTAAYRASAYALLAGESGSLKQLTEAFSLFEIAVKQYADVCALPEFLRGSVAENLPGWMYRKHRFAKIDFESIISKYEADKMYATPALMSFSYWAWANQHQKKKHRAKAVQYLNLAIELDAAGKAGKKRALELKAKLEKK